MKRFFSPTTKFKAGHLSIGLCKALINKPLPSPRSPSPQRGEFDNLDKMPEFERIALTKMKAKYEKTQQMLEQIKQKKELKKKKVWK